MYVYMRAYGHVIACIWSCDCDNLTHQAGMYNLSICFLCSWVDHSSTCECRGGRTRLQLRSLIIVKSLLGTFSRVLRVIFELGITDLPGDLTFLLYVYTEA